MEQEEQAPEDPMVLDIREAFGALSGDPYFVAAGIDEPFMEAFARNFKHFDKLPENAREQIRVQFRDMALEKSYRGKTNDDKSKMMADWFKSVNLMLVMAKRGMI